ncbi:hypothetical protein BHE74_00032554 [Ensete ventricosum]|nr:hypothetical protein BHE74_00032554 [Ensete ventricosum]
MRGSDKPRVERKRVGGVDVQMDRLCESVDEGSKRKRAIVHPLNACTHYDASMTWSLRLRAGSSIHPSTLCTEEESSINLRCSWRRERGRGKAPR